MTRKRQSECRITCVIPTTSLNRIENLPLIKTLVRVYSCVAKFGKKSFRHSRLSFSLPQIVNLYLALLKDTSRLPEHRFCWFQVHWISVHILDTHLNYQDLKRQASTSVTSVWQLLCQNLLLKKQQQQFWVFLDRHCSLISPLCLIEGPFRFDFPFFRFLCKFEASLPTVRHAPCHKLQRRRSSHWVADKLIDCENWMEGQR